MRRATRARAVLFIGAVAVTVLLLAGGECVTEYCAPVRPAELIVVLGGGVDERIAAAADASARGGARILWYFGPAGLRDTPAGRATYAYYRDLFTARGVDTADIIHRSAASSTWSEALAVRAYTRDHGVRSITVVTDPPSARRTRLMYAWAFARERCSWQIATSRLSWWDERRWWKNSRSLRAGCNEFMKMPYYLLRHLLEPDP